MRKKITLFMVILTAAIAVMAQGISVRFTARSANGAYHPFDTVRIENLSRGWTYSLVYPDTSIVLGSGSIEGIVSAEEYGELGLKVYPNPFAGSTETMIQLTKGGNVNMRIIRIDGTVVSSYSGILAAGEYRIGINMARPQVAFLCIETGEQRYVAKLVNSASGSADRIELNTIGNQVPQTKDTEPGDFEEGDTMRFTAIDVSHGTRTESEPVTEAFVEGGEMILTFETDAEPTEPTVSTAAIYDITTTSATCGGNVTDDGGEDVTARGVCWSTTSAPTTDDNHTTDGSGTGEFTSTISDLTPATTYYVRAYATNSVGTAYGEEVIFNTESIGGFDEVGASNAFFSVSTDRQVRFSRGNLQYQASTDTWRFAEHQYDRIWTDNLLISDTNSGWIDLFAWGTSGWNSGANEYMPWSHCKNNADYFIGGNYSINMTGIYADADWGVHNAISNGGNQSGMWRMLNADEWNYLINYRENASSKFGLVVVDSSYSGIAILPDEWIMPEGMIFRTGIQTSNTNRYTMDEWNMMENHGAIFLPMANSLGCGEMGWPVDAVGFYWSSSINTSTTTACYLNFCGGFIGFGTTNGRWLGMSVRLVRDSVPSCGHPAAIPTVTTTDASEIGTTQVICGGIVLDGGVTEVTDCGICWSTETNPSVVDSTVSNGSGAGNFEVTISNLLPGTVYYVRAYATNSVGTAYGNEVTFTTEEDSNLVEGGFDENGASYAIFSVAADKQVRFSKGNLQYRASTGIWQFAENQYDYIGNGNANISETYDGWIDLFGGGTSGWNSGAIAYQPWSSSGYNDDYISDNSDNANTDWGVYNAISNGGNQPGMWRTLTHDEFEYLIYNRNNAENKYGKASINGIFGFVILPDNWTLPDGVTFTAGLNSSAAISNTYSLEEWGLMEYNGAIFFPAAGYRSETSIQDVGYGCNYWLITSDYDIQSAMYYDAYVEEAEYLFDWWSKSDGCSVRLVKDCEDNHTVPSVSTSSVTNIGTSTAICGGSIDDDGGEPVIARGVCWSYEHNPTIADSHTYDGEGMGTFSSNISGLAPGITYYVRAYASNNVGTAYGNEQEFLTDGERLLGFDENGASYATFSVANGRQVSFSKGNLQYQASTGIWRFAENQYDCLENNNSNISETYDGWIDLFGWGTSGWNSGANAYQPWSTINASTDYTPGGTLKRMPYCSLLVDIVCFKSF